MGHEGEFSDIIRTGWRWSRGVTDRLAESPEVACQRKARLRAKKSVREGRWILR